MEPEISSPYSQVPANLSLSTKMYNEEKLYSVRSLVVIQILNFQRDLFVMRFVRLEDSEISLKCQNMYHN